MTKIGKTLSRGVLKTRKIAVDTAKDNGSLTRINKVIEMDNLGGRGKARRDARTIKKINKAKAPSKKARKAQAATAKSTAKVNKSVAKVEAAKSGKVKGAKVLETLNKGLDTAANVLGKGNAMPQTVIEEPKETKKAFDFLAWYMILIYLVIIGLIVYFAFIK